MKEKILKEIDKVDKQIEKLRGKRYKLKQDLLKYRIETRDYLSQEDLKNLPDQSICIDCVLDEKLEEIFLPDDEGVYIRNGFLDCSSYQNGFLDFSEKDDSYIHCYHGCEEKLDIKYIFLKENII